METEFFLLATGHVRANLGNYTKGSWRVNTIHADEINTCHAINNSF